MRPYPAVLLPNCWNSRVMVVERSVFLAFARRRCRRFRPDGLRCVARLQFVPPGRAHLERCSGVGTGRGVGLSRRCGDRSAVAQPLVCDTVPGPAREGGFERAAHLRRTDDLRRSHRPCDGEACGFGERLPVFGADRILALAVLLLLEREHDVPRSIRARPSPSTCAPPRSSPRRSPTLR